jgi:hypothetical protein
MIEKTLTELRFACAEAVKGGLARLPGGHTLMTVRTTYTRQECEMLLSTLDGTPDNPSVVDPVASPVLAIPQDKGNTPSEPESALVAAIRAIAGGANKPAELDIVTVQSLIDAAIAKIPTPELPTRTIVVNESRTVELNLGLQHRDLPLLVRFATAKKMCNVWVTGPSGSGKSQAAASVAKALGLNLYTVGACIMPSDLMGFTDANGSFRHTQFTLGMTQGGLVLMDEVDQYSERAVLAANEALSSGFIVVGGERVARHPDTVVIAGANTWGNGANLEYSGRTRLDGAFLNRFDFKTHLDYDEALEIALVGGQSAWTQIVHKARKNARSGGVRAIISTRQIIAGAALIANGFSLGDAIKYTYGAGLDEQTLIKLAA